MITLNRILSRIGIIWVAFAAGMAHAAEPVAMVTDAKGNAWIQGKSARLQVLSYLEQGAIIRVDHKATITISTFNPAEEYVSSGPSRLELKGGGVHLLDGGKLQSRKLNPQTTRAAQKFSATQRERLTMAAYEMKALAIGVQLLSPVNAELLNIRPEFKWSAPQEAKKFVVTLLDEQSNTLVDEVSVNKPNWQLPKNLSLQAGHAYTWKVRSMLPSGEEMGSTGKFSVVDAARANQVLQQKPSRMAPFSEKVLYAVYLDSEGLKVDAADEWNRLAIERPNEPLLNPRY